MEDAKTAQARAELEALACQPAVTPEERFRVLDALDRFLRQTTERTTDIRKARSIIGTCPDMCPEKERYLREWKIMVPSYERQPGSNHIDHQKAIKQYSRSSADQVLPLPHELRTEQALGGTMYFLWSQHADRINADQGGGANVSDWYHYIWDRTRSIRKDITQQELCSPTVVEFVQQCARFHIHCAARYVTEDPSVFDQKINTENLTKCLQTLKYLYSDLRQQQIQCPDEPEFRAYMMLLYLNEGNFQSELRELSATIIHSEPVQFALSVHLTLVQNNYVRFFAMVRNTSYMNACILLRYFTQVRQTALDVIRKSYASRSTANFPLAYLAGLLGFDQAADALEFFSHYGVTVDQTGEQPVVQFEAKQQALSPDVPHSSGRSQMVERKLTGTVGEAICGKSLETWGTQFPPAPCVSSFDQFGLLRQELLQKVLHPGTLDPEGAMPWVAILPPEEDTMNEIDLGSEDIFVFNEEEEVKLDDDKPLPRVRTGVEFDDTLTMSSSVLLIGDEEPVDRSDAEKQTAAGAGTVTDSATTMTYHIPPVPDMVVSAGRKRTHFGAIKFPSADTLAVSPGPSEIVNNSVNNSDDARVVPLSEPPAKQVELFDSTFFTPRPVHEVQGQCTTNEDPEGIDYDEHLFELVSEADVDMESIVNVEPLAQGSICQGQYELHPTAEQNHMEQEETAVEHTEANSSEIFHQSIGGPLSPVEKGCEAVGEAKRSKVESIKSASEAEEVEEDAEELPVETDPRPSEEAKGEEADDRSADSDKSSGEVELGRKFYEEVKDMKAESHWIRTLKRKYFAKWSRAARNARSWRRMMNTVPSVQPLASLVNFDRLEPFFRSLDTSTKSFVAVLNEPAVRINLLPFDEFRASDLIRPFDILRTAVQTTFAWDLPKLRDIVKPIYWRLVISIPSEHDDPQLVGFPSFVERWLRECTVKRFSCQELPDHSNFFLEAREEPLFDCWAPHTAICMRLVRGTRGLNEKGAADARVCSRYNGLLLFLNDQTPMSVERERLRALISSDGPPPAAIAVMYYSRSKKLPLDAVQAQLLDGVDLRDGSISVRVFYWTDIATNRTICEALAYLADSHCRLLNHQHPAKMLRMQLLGDLLDGCLGRTLWFRWNQATCAMNERLPKEFRCLRLTAITLDANALVDLYNACLKRVLEQIGNPFVMDRACVHSDFDAVRLRWRTAMDPEMFRQPLSEGYFAPQWDIFPADLLCELEQKLMLYHLPHQLLAATQRVYGMLAYNKVYGNVPRPLDLDELRSCLRNYLRCYSHLLDPGTLSTLECNMLTSLVNQLAGGSVVDEALLVVGRGRTTRNVFWPTVLRFLTETLLKTLLQCDRRIWREVYYIHGWFTSFTNEESFWKDTEVFINYKPNSVPGFPSP
ncbi:uncharacterized protein LOC131291163 [Anopheles ziemanni]|uniref:uncharacterized protein LOC131269650 n=1 Tax=Anopheles coustani TaxID=139045 RepID=UPI00265AEC8A|nr:uncharacterized protein LOC131269650 [Anopheles coustani]XP_058176337.1 uncharacterized protein LOC131291163 [Anopheles ziemanni]